MTLGDFCDRSERHPSIEFHFLEGIVIALCLNSDSSRLTGGATILQQYKVHERSWIGGESVSNKKAPSDLPAAILFLRIYR